MVFLVDAFRVLRAAETFVVVVRADFVVLFGALLVALFGAALTAGLAVALTAGLAVALTAGLAVALTADLAAGFAALTVAFTAGLALVLTAALAIRLDVAFTGVFATVVSSTPARMALRRTEVTPFIAAAFEPYGCEIATVEPFAACRVNRNLPALSLLMVNFAGTNASRCGAGALCGRRWAPIEHWSARRDHASAVLRETLSLSSELPCELLLAIVPSSLPSFVTTVAGSGVLPGGGREMTNDGRRRPTDRQLTMSLRPKCHHAAAKSTSEYASDHRTPRATWSHTTVEPSRSTQEYW